ncbi:hypothetical protein pEaSNUABM50_00387 [Erwinia phage pEa_SNUABM_50]|uniref:Uncharacterized protein n=4 Tax=Eneladusvirus BF TaxID=2560751 RepID=A0A7L8ZPA7_9CAUD|nr:hypothetical protein FDH34_gp532 [Serratia phage BF]QOI71326.1 hypothetical protein pEaSNUABM12_00392 [Erwinia phage pEa_SNUABM_12]QOI71869.1 hypothetical protein pEaSNUABM47_00389 [Erwinia phage pEa_SNUABM_47]QOI72408.1 hypothetical protein pEaSNUABM50_00387 [Erwinia phage pEa_SNUABM_50]QXO11535.1 hypothetical protein pEaSNUABM19_00393 [Erwinia phage pEa_SNUABM_19]QXO12083.1 hypothetical protein pEaSNUABM44_00391 [Erwinia phage pEa_SNUABM_44]QXO12635.1 hypothetical protein pEaSNUABM49_003
MAIKAKLNFCDLDLDYARTAWDGAYMVLAEVNEVLKERGIKIEFLLEVHSEEDYPSKFWDEEDVEYTTNTTEITDE